MAHNFLGLSFELITFLCPYFPTTSSSSSLLFCCISISSHVLSTPPLSSFSCQGNIWCQAARICSFFLSLWEKHLSLSLTLSLPLLDAASCQFRQGLWWVSHFSHFIITPLSIQVRRDQMLCLNGHIASQVATDCFMPSTYCQTVKCRARNVCNILTLFMYSLAWC